MNTADLRKRCDDTLRPREDAWSNAAPLRRTPPASTMRQEAKIVGNQSKSTLCGAVRRESFAHGLRAASYRSKPFFRSAKIKPGSSPAATSLPPRNYLRSLLSQHSRCFEPRHRFGTALRSEEK